MTTSTGAFLGRVHRGTRVLAVIIAVTMVVVVTRELWPDPPRSHVTAYFPRTVGLYEGSDVRVLGVPIGQVDAITPQGTRVRVEMSYNADHKLPADAKAAVLSPSVVSDRYVQFTPVYKGGPAMKDGTTLPEGRTAVPVELDRIYQSVNDLSVALGPKGANKNGALSRLLRVGADNLDGRGKKVNQTVQEVAEATDTISKNRKDLFATVRKLQNFTSTLAESDSDVRRFNSNLASVADQLSGEREDLRAALTHLSSALSDVRTFVRTHRGKLKENVHGLTKLSKTLVKQKEALAETLETSPVALQNLNRTYNGGSATLDTRNNFSQLRDPDQYLCSLLEQLDQPDRVCDLLGEALDDLDGPVLPARSSAGHADRSDAGGAGGAGGSGGSGGGPDSVGGRASGGADGTGSAGPPAGRSDPTLGGLLEER